MKHLVLAPIWPPARYGGIEIIAKRLCDAMAATDEVVVVSVSPTAATATRRTLDSVEVLEVPGHFFSPLAADATNAAVMELARPLMRGVDVIHCHDWFLADAATVMSDRGIPLVGYFHTLKRMERLRLGQTESASRRYSEEKQAHLAARSAIVAVYSDFMRKNVCEAFGSAPAKVVTFMCGPTLPLEFHRSVKRRERDVLQVTYFGRLAPEKGIDLLLEAHLAMNDKTRATNLRVVGVGPVAQVLMDRAAGASSMTSISFEPFITDPVALMLAYAASDLVVVPSRFEAYGLVAAEALTLGVPVAVASTGGLPEIVGHGDYGEVFEPDDPDEILKALHIVRGDPERSRSRAARGRAIHGEPKLWHDAATHILAALPSPAARRYG